MCLVDKSFEFEMHYQQMHWRKTQKYGGKQE